MAKTLTLASDLSLPLTAVTETFGVLAARGAGKSNLATVLAEQMAKAGLPFVVVDPVGSWFGLRAGADGQKGGGLPIPIFGGAHGDVALERGSGVLVADLVVSKRLSCVLDLSAFESESAKKGFLLDFARRLYLRNTDPLHLFLEEADDYIPQRPMRDEAQLLRAWENIVRRGRSRGLGMTLITQRSASINKSVLTQVQTLFVLRTTGPQDRAAIEAWVKYHDTDEKVLSSLSGLAPGEGWVWSPQFLERMSKHQFHRRQTFDSGATPKNLRGKDAKAAATLADVDLTDLQQQMAATVERAKADDPKELRKQLAERDRQIRALTDSRKTSIESPGKDVPVLTDADRKLLEKVVEGAGALADRDEDAVAASVKAIEKVIEQAVVDGLARAAVGRMESRIRFAERIEKAGFQRILEKLDRVSVAKEPYRISPTRHAHESLKTLSKTSSARENPSKTGVSAGSLDSQSGHGLQPAKQRILDALAWLNSIRVQAWPRQVVAFVAGASSKSSAYANNVSALRTAGLVEYPQSNYLSLSDAGARQANPPDAPLTPGDLHRQIQSLLQPAQWRIVDAAIKAYPHELTREALADAAGASASSSAFSNNVSPRANARSD